MLDTTMAAATDNKAGTRTYDAIVIGGGARHGILLLVHQGRRRWKDTRTGGAFVEFNEVVKRLHVLAARISGESRDAPQPEIAVVDVSAVNSGPIARKQKSRPAPRQSPPEKAQNRKRGTSTGRPRKQHRSAPDVSH